MAGAADLEAATQEQVDAVHGIENAISTLEDAELSLACLKALPSAAGHKTLLAAANAAVARERKKLPELYIAYICRSADALGGFPQPGLVHARGGWELLKRGPTGHQRACPRRCVSHTAAQPALRPASAPALTAPCIASWAVQA